MIKILVVHSTNNIISGAEYAISDMLTPIPEEFLIEMQTPGNGELSKFYKDKGFVVHTNKFSGPRRKYLGLFWISSILYALWLRKGKYDIILCNTFAASFRVSLASKLARVKLIIYTREYFSKKKNLNYKQIRRADAIFAVSEDVKSYYENLHKKIIVCHDTIDISTIRTRSESHKCNLLNPSLFNVGYVGRITKYKQPDLLIRSIPKVKEKIPNAHFHIIGSSIKAETYFEESLKVLVNELRVSKFVKFWGHRKDSIEILKELDVFCLTSDREPFPRTVLESMLCKTPVVCSDTGGCTELVKDNETGLLFDVLGDERIEDLSNKIIQYYEDKILYNKIQNRAYTNVVDEFSEKKQVKHFFESLKSLK